MDKPGVVAALEEIAVLLELSGENPFKARSYTNVARALEQTEEDIETLVREERLREIKGVGEALEQKITELVTTDRLEYLDELRARFPESLFDLFKIQGLGAKRIKTVYEKLGVASIDDLEAACEDGRLAQLKGFGTKMQDKVLQGLAFAKEHQGTFLYSVAAEAAERLRAYLAKDRATIRIEVAGSIRRCKEVVKDIDILASSKKPAALMERFTTAPGVARVTAHGETKSSVVLDSGIAADLRVVSDAQFPYALHHFTGSREHNVALRQRARERGLKMNEYGLFRDDKNTRCRDEAALFKQLDLPCIPPELREDMGELEALELPRLVERGDLIGMYHVHSTYSDGHATVEQMARATRKLGYQYMVLTDHSQSAAYAGGLSPEAVKKQHREVDALNKKLRGFRILKGIESDIRKGGLLDYDADTFARFDFVVVSVHSQLDMTEAIATARLIKAVEHDSAMVLGHPTGRLLLERKGYPLDMDKVIDACAANGVAIEINAAPNRLDLDWRYVRRAKERGVKLCIGTDAHRVEGLDWIRYGLGVARKGWLEAADLLNSMTVEEFFAWRDSRRR